MYKHAFLVVDIHKSMVAGRGERCGARRLTHLAAMEAALAAHALADGATSYSSGQIGAAQD